MLLALDVGNTNTVLGLYSLDTGSNASVPDSAKLVAHWRVSTHRTQTADEYGVLFTNLFNMHGLSTSKVQAIIISIIVMLNHCYYGFYASGGPVGVGEAVGRSMRASLIAIVLVVLFASLALYGTNANFNLTV